MLLDFGINNSRIILLKIVQKLMVYIVSQQLSICRIYYFLHFVNTENINKRFDYYYLYCCSEFASLQNDWFQISLADLSLSSVPVQWVQMYLNLGFYSLPIFLSKPNLHSLYFYYYKT